MLPSQHLVLTQGLNRPHSTKQVLHRSCYSLLDAHHGHHASCTRRLLLLLQRADACEFVAGG